MVMVSWPSDYQIPDTVRMTREKKDIKASNDGYIKWKDDESFCEQIRIFDRVKVILLLCRSPLDIRVFLIKS